MNESQQKCFKIGCDSQCLSGFSCTDGECEFLPKSEEEEPIEVPDENSKEEK